MSEFMRLAAVIGALWLSGFGAAMIVGQHGRYVAFTRRELRRASRACSRLVVRFWRRWRTQVIWFAIGFVVALYLFH